MADTRSARLRSNHDSVGWFTYLLRTEYRCRRRSAVSVLRNFSFDIRELYGFLIGSIFSGIVGTGFYPIFGNRMWCRFGCPLAAYMGFIQRFKSRFRITTNGGQCISCGELLDVLRTRHRCQVVCTAWAKHCAFILCRLWCVLSGLSERGFEA